jgi:hypothetical protein
MTKLQAKPRQEHTCCGVIQEARHETREKRTAQNRAQPWIALKFAVGLTIGLEGYASYVYVGRFCVPMILRQRKALSSRTMGSESWKNDFVVLKFIDTVSCILGGVFDIYINGYLGLRQGGVVFMTKIWTLSNITQVIFVSPGFAKDVCSMQNTVLPRR